MVTRILSSLIIITWSSCADARRASIGLSDPVLQPKFVTPVVNPLDPSFLYNISTGYIEVSVSTGSAETGLVSPDGRPLSTAILGYGTPELGYTWPGRTFEVQKDEMLQVKWLNKIPIDPGYLLKGKDNGLHGNFEGKSVIDFTIRWSYGLPRYELYSVEEHGTPIVTHLHGGHVISSSDGNPGHFFSPDFAIKGPFWENEVYSYDNSQPAAPLFYHDHALGMTRLNVYSGLTGFYIIRDDIDTGKPDNILRLPTYPYELPLAIEDRMFKENGELFYPAFRGDPFYEDFIIGEGATIPQSLPSSLAEFFGDHMVVNG